MTSVVVQKIQSIQRCVSRAREEYKRAGIAFREDHTRQDAALLNVTRACEQSIDLANHLVREEQLGLPASSAESFELLERAGILSAGLRRRLGAMVGFRNTAVHQYTELDLDIVEHVIQTGLDDLLALTDAVLQHKQR
jgi:uncharacterized protein YutE (UPF0331/DUF86 family)